MRDSEKVKEALFRSCKQKLMEKVVFDSLKAQIMIRTKIIAGKGWEPSNLACLFSCKKFLCRNWGQCLLGCNIHPNCKEVKFKEEGMRRR